MVAELSHGFGRIDRNPPCQRCLRAILLRHHNGIDPRFFCGEYHGQHTGYAPELPAHAEFPQKGPVIPGQPQLSRRSQNAKKNRQVVDRTGFFCARRGQIDGDACCGELKPRTGNGGPDTLSGFLYRRIRKSYNIKPGKPRCNAALHLHKIACYPRKSHGSQMQNHVYFPLPQ